MCDWNRRRAIAGSLFSAFQSPICLTACVHLNSSSVAAAARGEQDGCFEPPVTPVGRDDLELRRHRFFNELLKAAQAAREHRVRFNPLGPEIAQMGDGEEECGC